jgi:hypothetical protein
MASTYIAKETNDRIYLGGGTWESLMLIIGQGGIPCPII